jgi:hypothetical protein
MSLTHSNTDHAPLFNEVEMHIRDIDVLAQNIGLLMLGHHRHVALILAAKQRAAPPSTGQMIDRAQSQLLAPIDELRYRRDGWIFQLMTWNSLRMEYEKDKILSNPPHPNPAQHGIDGVGIVLDDDNRIRTLFIAEDKCTEKPRPTIYNDVWPEFKRYEDGEFDSLIVSTATSLLHHLTDDEVDAIVTNDIYFNDNRVYRAGITPLPNKSSVKHRRKLFKDFDKFVKGANHLRRQGLTFSQPDIRKFMDDFSIKIADFLETQRR